MATRTIAHLAFTYRVPIGSGGYRRIRADRGDTVDIPLPEDVERGDRLGAFVVAAGRVEPTEPAAMSDAELIAWLSEDRPQAADLIAAAQGDPELAKRLLAAEYATGSRHAAIIGLARIAHPEMPPQTPSYGEPNNHKEAAA